VFFVVIFFLIHNGHKGISQRTQCFFEQRREERNIKPLYDAKDHKRDTKKIFPLITLIGADLLRNIYLRLSAVSAGNKIEE
jgi:hypothetical protein